MESNIDDIDPEKLLLEITRQALETIRDEIDG